MDAPTSGWAQPDQSVSVADRHVSAGGFSEVGAIDWRDIYRGYVGSPAVLVAIAS